jgi:23S rRNA (cytidine1920-2'-O)/16S rRNA (cytidine1409-2'-O)-methyltransferase
MAMRADQLLVERGLAPSRSAAQRLLAQRAVRWRLGEALPWAVVAKAGQELAPHALLEVTDDAETRWVSRGGLKLEAALTHTAWDVSGHRALDVGQSTGGFTQVLLARGASHVTGVDVGHGQLHEQVRRDPRVAVFEGLHARDLDAAPLPHARYDLVVADLSFISLTLVLPMLARRAASHLLLLVKPQFELQPADIGKGGLVSDPALHRRVQDRVLAAASAAQLTVLDYFDSPIAGGDGNREHFLWARTLWART